MKKFNLNSFIINKNPTIISSKEALKDVVKYIEEVTESDQAKIGLVNF